MQQPRMPESFQAQIKEAKEALKEEAKKFRWKGLGWQIAAMFCEFLQSMFFVGFAAGVVFSIAIATIMQ